METEAPLWVILLTAIMAFGVPLLFLSFGIWMFTKTRRFMANAQQINATVVDIGENRRFDEGVMHTDYLPVYEYRSMTGGMERATAFRSVNARPDIGDQHAILINPNEPGVARYSAWAGYAFAAFGIGIGAPTLIAVIRHF